MARRRFVRPREGRLPVAVYELLTAGWTLDDVQLSDDELRRIWFSNRDVFMREVERRGQPFWRPSAFWRFEAPDRRRLRGVYGFHPCSGWGFYESPVNVKLARTCEWDEPPQDYLARHPELLTDCEREILEAKAVAKASEGRFPEEGG